MSYTRAIRIEFNHCDPAGIVFYPRYFEMTNSVCENFYRDVLGLPFEDLMAAGCGVPLKTVETEFIAPSHLGEVLEWRLDVEKVGGSSVALLLEASVAGAVRLRAALVQVHVGPGGRPIRWPERVRNLLLAHLEAS